MKKTVLFLILSLVMVKCKDKVGNSNSERNQEDTAKVENCTNDMSGYTKLTIEKDQIEWLKNNGSNVCKPTFFQFLRNDHRLKRGEYDIKIDSNETPLRMRWAQISPKIKGHFYDKYIEFTGNSGQLLSMGLTDDFSTTKKCFSIPLLLSIADTLKLADNDTTIFEFARTKETKSLIVFKVVGYPNLEMNYSTKPSK